MGRSLEMTVRYSSDLTQVMGIGSVGTNFPQAKKTFFAHTAGVPEISSVVLEDFDSTSSNEFYHSNLDDLC
ncbi:nicastrin isoform X3 [Salvia divinorum]|uniref:Nicastrin isoform X3 n=1 Tax=Salvia divinorum TaxID=28513 RepID=A0ABD1HXG0_SALDI